MDDRAGVAVFLVAVDELKKYRLRLMSMPATTQEEVGLKEVYHICIRYPPGHRHSN